MRPFNFVPSVFSSTVVITHSTAKIGKINKNSLMTHHQTRVYFVCLAVALCSVLIFIDMLKKSAVSDCDL
jgi:hypothetical protein